jgi:hypothetical protein
VSSVGAIGALAACNSVLAGFTLGRGAEVEHLSRSSIADDQFYQCSNKALKRRLAERPPVDAPSLTDAAMAECAAEQKDFLTAEIADYGESDGDARFARSVDLTRLRLQNVANRALAAAAL